MTTFLDANYLTLKEVHRRRKLQRRTSESFESWLSLEPLSDRERQDLQEICRNFASYYEEGRVSEGEVKFLILSPLLWLAGFYEPRLKITLEENIVPIQFRDGDTVIKGRMDILAIARPEEGITPLWILLIESKRSGIDAWEGLPQLLTYAYTSLEHQDSVWGLTTNGIHYQFVYLQKTTEIVYFLLPELNSLRPEHPEILLQVLNSIARG